MTQPTYTLHSLADTKKLAAFFATDVPEPPILALVGQLGAGKTTFVSTLARALGTTATPASPTFVWLKTYPLTRGRFRRLHHIDCYRTTGLDPELADTIQSCQNDPEAITIIEWADKIKPHLDPRATWMTFMLLATGVRTVAVKRFR